MPEGLAVLYHQCWEKPGFLFEIEIEKEEIRSFQVWWRIWMPLCRWQRMILRKHSASLRIQAFPEFLKVRIKSQTLYQGLSRQPVTYQHLEEFLIAAGKKRKLPSAPGKWAKEYYELKDSVKESFYIQRSGWGHLRLDVEAIGDFLDIPRKVVTDEDFIGSHYEVEYLLP